MTTVTDTSKVLGITLEWVFGDWFRGDAEAREAERKKHFERMTAALRAAGYSVEDVTETQPNGVQRFLRIGIAVENPS
jgi:microsomal dipeptidase-like Zn-dependent dipeptidase